MNEHGTDLDVRCDTDRQLSAEEREELIMLREFFELTKYYTFYFLSHVKTLYQKQDQIKRWYRCRRIKR